MSQLCVPLLLTSLLAACKLQEGPHQLGLSGLGSVWPGATLISSADCGGCGSDHPNLSQHPSALNIDRGGIFLTFESNLLHSNVPILPSLCPPSPLRLFFFLTFFFSTFLFPPPNRFPPSVWLLERMMKMIYTRKRWRAAGYQRSWSETASWQRRSSLLCADSD